MSGYKGLTPARVAANKRYDEKTYKRFNLLLRVEEDAEIIKSLEEAIERGSTKREWLSEIFYNQK